jgi:hypothetical protein
VTGTALAQVEERRERAEFVAAAEKYCRNFLRGFTPDGYCSEGLEARPESPLAGEENC